MGMMNSTIYYCIFNIVCKKKDSQRTCSISIYYKAYLSILHNLFFFFWYCYLNFLFYYFTVSKWLIDLILANIAFWFWVKQFYKDVCFLSVYTLISRKKAPNFNLKVVLNRKLDLVCNLKRSILNTSSIIFIFGKKNKWKTWNFYTSPILLLK